MARWVFKDGEWAEGKASPEHLRKELRDLPSTLVTKDDADENRVHELDESHTVKALRYEWDKEQAGGKEDDPLTAVAKSLTRVPVGESAPLTQERVDVERFHAIRSTLETYEAQLARGLDVDVERVYHLWFPTDDVNRIELRDGNPPANVDRPKHMQGIDLVVDPLCPPRRIRDKFRELGVEIPDARTGLVA